MPRIFTPAQKLCRKQRDRIRYKHRKANKLCYTCGSPDTRGKSRCGGCLRGNLISVNKSAESHEVNPRTERERKIRMECVAHYGGECARCGESIYPFLTIDHIDGGGKQHRESEKIWRIGNYLKRRNWPIGYQVLCWNCNHKKWLGELRQNQLQTIEAIRCREKIKRLRAEVFNLYGGCCACCGESDHDILTVDHLDNDGAGERREFRNKDHFYKWLLTQGVLAKYSIGCFNCNCGRAANSGVCPHGKSNV